MCPALLLPLLFFPLLFPLSHPLAVAAGGVEHAQRRRHRCTGFAITVTVTITTVSIDTRRGPASEMEKGKCPSSLQFARQALRTLLHTFLYHLLTTLATSHLHLSRQATVLPHKPPSAVACNDQACNTCGQETSEAGMCVCVHVRAYCWSPKNSVPARAKLLLSLS